MKSTKFMLQAAVIAAVYATLTLVLMPLSYGVMQIRVSEAL
ncbi:MAG: QueT transporter, partial [Bacillota bacterium]|nr:QueT transporter [Bacillota bacterium]